MDTAAMPPAAEVDEGRSSPAPEPAAPNATETTSEASFEAMPEATSQVTQETAAEDAPEDTAPAPAPAPAPAAATAAVSSPPLPPRSTTASPSPSTASMSTTAAASTAPVPPLPPRSYASSLAPAPAAFSPLLCVVDFHHARGPEVEMWFGNETGRDDDGDGDDKGTGPNFDPAVQYNWPLLPFMALSDGAHAATEDFSYFTLLKPAPPGEGGVATSLFGLSCTRQIDAATLRNRSSDVTRSTVQKAVVLITDSPAYFGMLRERLSVVTKAWFDQRDFTDVDILRRFQEALADEKARGALGGSGGSGGVSPRIGGNDGSSSGGVGVDEDRDQYLGMSLRELVHEFRWQTLVLLKCCLLQPKMLFFGSRCERLCMMQFSLVSLIPGLLRNLQDCAGPELDSYAQRLKTPTSLRTSDRGSLLAYMGLPLQIFGRGSLFGPYTPLQQLDVLADFGTKSYIVGSTNSLLLQQRDRYSDILINLDDRTVNITSASLRTALQLSVPDRRWIDVLTQAVNDTWDDANPGHPKTMGYGGSEDFIRLQFEGYLLSLLSSVKYHRYITTVNPRTGRPPAPPPLPQFGHGYTAGTGSSNNGSGGGGGADKDITSGDPSLDFGADFIDAWSRTENYRLWQAHTDSHLFEFVEPRHPCAGGLSIEDVQRRIAQQVQDLHLDERLAQGREALGRNLAAGREKASTLFNKFYADVEALRESQRRKAEEARQHQQQSASSDADGGDSRHHHLSHGHRGTSSSSSSIASGTTGSSNPAGPDPAKAQQQQQQQQQATPSVGTRASAYMSSWASWAGEKRKTGWGRQPGSGGGSNPNRNTMSSALSDRSSTSLERGGGRSGGSGGGLGGLRMSISSFRTAGTGTGTANASPTTATAVEADFPPDVIIRNLDEELPPPTPPPRPSAQQQQQQQTPPSPQLEKEEETSSPKGSTGTESTPQDGGGEATAEASTTAETSTTLPA